MPNKGPNGHDDHWTIYDTVQGKVIERWPTKIIADQYCLMSNNHEEKNGRSRRYTVQEA